MRSDPVRTKEQSEFLWQPLSGPFTSRAAVEPRDPLPQSCHAKSQGQSMGSGLFPEHQSIWELHSPLRKVPSQPSLLTPHSSVRQVTTQPGLLVLPAAWINTGSSQGSARALMLARQNVVP